MLMRRMKEAGFPFNRVVGVSGCGQQHGSVYWCKGAGQILSQLDHTIELVDQLQVSTVATLSYSSDDTNLCRGASQ